MKWFDLICNKFISKSNHDLIWKDFWFDLIWFEMIWNAIPNHVLFFMIDALLVLVFWYSILYSRYLKNKIISNQIFDLICLHHWRVLFEIASKIKKARQPIFRSDHLLQIFRNKFALQIFQQQIIYINYFLLSFTSNFPQQIFLIKFFHQIFLHQNITRNDKY